MKDTTISAFLDLLNNLAPGVNVKVLKEMGQPIPEIANLVALSVFINDVQHPDVATLRTYLKVLHEKGYYEFE